MLAATSGAGPALAAVFAPAAPSVTAGSAFSLMLDDTIALNDGIAGLDLKISFDPNVLSFVDALDGGLLPGWSIVSRLSSPGVALISASEPSNATSDANGTGVVVLLDFTAKPGAPTTHTTVTAATTSDGAGVAGEYQVDPTGVSVAVTAAIVAVPAPGLSFLAIPAFALLRGKRRKT